MFYERLLRPMLFRFDPERVHNTILFSGRMLGSNPLTRVAVRGLFAYRHPSLQTRVLGIDFENPLGLSAGFDKDGMLTRIIPEVGFGFMEVGSVTRLPSEGNHGKHLVRLPLDKAIIVYYGLKSDGAEKVLRRLRDKKHKIPVGINVAKTNNDAIRGDASIEDFVKGYELLSPHFSYTTINVSCPNVQDGCSFQDPHLLHNLLSEISKKSKHGPVLLKLGNDHNYASLEKVLAVSERFAPLVDGFILSNLAKDRTRLALRSPNELLFQLPHGGISGAPIRAHANDLLRHAFRVTKGKYAFVGVGGVFSAEDAYEKIRSGASLVELITGMIYGGPGTIKKINQGLVALLARDGFKHVSEAVGVDAR